MISQLRAGVNVKAGRFLIITVLAVTLALVDQMIKGLVVNALTLDESRPLISGLLWLTYRQNTGMAFSLLQSAAPWVIIVINLLVAGIMLVIITPFVQRPLGLCAGALLLGGSLGNLYDRVQRHYVIDYLDFRVWPVFNLADICIFLGMLCLLLVLLNDSRVARPTAGENGL